MKSFLMVAIIALASCKKESPDPISVSLQVHVDQSALVKDAFNYANEAGSKYSVNRLQFYLSDFRFTNADGEISTDTSIIYIDYFQQKGLTFSLPQIQKGEFKKIEFNVGIGPDRNLTNRLPNVKDNVDMAWPMMMGGGYHFMKLEGNHISNTDTTGFAIHLGNNKHLVSISMNGVWNWEDKNPVFSMNVNEWFKNPAIYDFKTDGNYTMGIDSLMSKISKNGTDVFTIQ